MLVLVKMTVQVVAQILVLDIVKMTVQMVA